MISFLSRLSSPSAWQPFFQPPTITVLPDEGWVEKMIEQWIRVFLSAFEQHDLEEAGWSKKQKDIPKMA